MAMTRDRTHVTERALPSVDEGRHEPDWASRLPVNAKTTAIATRAYGWGRSGFGESRTRPALFHLYPAGLPTRRTGSSHWRGEKPHSVSVSGPLSSQPPRRQTFDDMPNSVALVTTLRVWAHLRERHEHRDGKPIRWHGKSST